MLAPPLALLLVLLGPSLDLLHRLLEVLLSKLLLVLQLELLRRGQGGCSKWRGRSGRGKSKRERGWGKRRGRR